MMREELLDPQPYLENDLTRLVAQGLIPPTVTGPQIPARPRRQRVFRLYRERRAERIAPLLGGPRPTGRPWITWFT